MIETNVTCEWGYLYTIPSAAGCTVNKLYRTKRQAVEVGADGHSEAYRKL